MLKIKKIKDKEEIVVLSQKRNCRINGRPKEYMPGDCMNDCKADLKPLWYESQAT